MKKTMSLEGLPNATERGDNLEITSSAKEDLKAFEDFIKGVDPKILNNTSSLSDFIYLNFCTKSDEREPSKKTRKQYIDSIKSVEKDLTNINGVKVGEDYNDWVGYEVNGSYDEYGSMGRVYINTKVEYTSGVFKKMVENLQKGGLHCDIKTIKGDDERDFSRLDKIVIYFNGAESRKIHRTLQEYYITNTEKFNKEIPRFTRQLKDMPGIGFGEDSVFPDKSFSDIRAKILAKVYNRYRNSEYDEKFNWVGEFQQECPFFQVDSRDPSRNLPYLES